MRCFITGAALFFITSLSQAQDSTLFFSSRIQAALTSDQTPLWLHANQFGRVPIRGPYLAGQLGLYRKYSQNKTRKIVDWSMGAEVVAYAGQKSDLFLTDAFIAGKLGTLELSAGQRKETVGLMDTTLTSGSLSISGNSRPYPRIQLALPKFVSLGFTKNFLAIKGSYSDGLLGQAAVRYGNVDRVPAIYLHHKSLYVRLGKAEQRLHLYGGFNHQAIWGGENLIFTGGLERPLAYKYVVIGKPWANSRVGNHFGTIDMGADWSGENWTYFAYRQNPYEDGSLSQLTNVADGLNGLCLSRKNNTDAYGLQIRTLLVEFLTTKSQGGNIFDIGSQVFGRDDYYNHYVYTQGWSYRGRILGTPMIPTQNLQRPEIPKDTASLTVNNRLWAVHTGFIAQLRSIKVQIRGTISRNFGTYNYPLTTPQNQISFFAQVETPVAFAKGSFLTVRLATDLGKLYPTTYGLEVGWRKQGFL